LPIITTPHAKTSLTTKKGDAAFTAVTDLDHFDSVTVDIAQEQTSKTAPAIRVTAMPGKHVPPGIIDQANELLGAVPPVNGWMLELGHKDEDQFSCGYRIYISGDTLMVDDLKEIPRLYKDQKIDLMLVHLGGTTIPGPKIPLIMVTMDAFQGLELLNLVNPDITIPIHYDDYDVFLSPLSDFKQAIQDAGLQERVVYLERGDEYKFRVK